MMAVRVTVTKISYSSALGETQVETFEADRAVANEGFLRAYRTPRSNDPFIGFNLNNVEKFLIEEIEEPDHEPVQDVNDV
jgi:hypothetical protein